jgi:two-component system, NarL family, nitrate/nitrite response regulator NarL
MSAQILPLTHNRSYQPEYATSLTRPIPTALICDNAFLNSGLQQILSGSPFVIAEAASVAGSRRFQGLAPKAALVVIEASQNTGRLLEIVRQVREQAPEARIVALADQFDLSFVRLGHEAGVDGFCLAAADPEVLIKSLELVMLGETVVPTAVLRTLAIGPAQGRDQPLHQNSPAEPSPSDLTTCKLSTRETQILNCLRQGAPNKAIARRLDVAEATVKVHIKAILRKIGASNRTQAAMWATTHLPPRGAAVQRI